MGAERAVVAADHAALAERRAGAGAAACNECATDLD
jgi:hypothetical protein